MSQSDFEVFNLQEIGNIFNKCFAFNLSREYNDYEILARFIHGPVFDGFILVKEIPLSDGKIGRETLATLTLAHRKLDAENDVVLVYNMCISPNWQGKGLGRILMQKAFQMFYKRLNLTPSKEKPVLLALCLLVQNPAFDSACKMYGAQGYYYYEYTNVAHQHDGELLRIISKLKNLSTSTPSTIYNFDFEHDRNSMQKKTPYYSFIDENSKKAISFYRLDSVGDGQTLNFAFPLTTFCQKVRPFMVERVELLNNSRFNNKFSFNEEEDSIQQKEKNASSNAMSDSIDENEEEEENNDYFYDGL